MPGNAPARARSGVAVVLVLLAMAGCGGSGGGSPTVGGDSTATTAAGAPATVLGVTVRGGSVVDGNARQKAAVNHTVTIRVTSDAADELHVHGYNKMVEVAAGRTAEVTFVANIPGVFEVEFEKSRKLLFTLEVS